MDKLIDRMLEHYTKNRNQLYTAYTTLKLDPVWKKSDPKVYMIPFVQSEIIQN